MHDHDLIRVGAIGIRYLLEPEQTNGALAMFEFAVPAGAKVPVPHFHKEYDETIYGLEGILHFTIAGQTRPIAPGESCFIPRGVVHGFDNVGQANAKGLAVITPGKLRSAFFREVAALMTGGPPDVAAIQAVMLKHGLVPVPPQ